MNASAPPPIALDDLDREELLQLLHGRFMLFTIDDLWRARWEVLSERASVARAKASDALGDYLTATPDGRRGAPLSSRQMIREIKDQESRKAAWKRAEGKAKQAEAAEERAWRAMEACSQRRGTA